MIQKIKRWIYSKFFLFDDVTPMIRATSVDRTCTRDAETRKRVAKAFEQQEKQIQTRAMKAHGPDCKEPLDCKKRICFKQVPDKIVKT